MKNILTEEQKRAIALSLNAKCEKIGIPTNWVVVFYANGATEKSDYITDLYEVDAIAALSEALVSLAKEAQTFVGSFYNEDGTVRDPDDHSQEPPA